MEALNPSAMEGYGRCLDDGDEFDRAMSKFAATYVEQNLDDHNSFVRAIEQGRISAQFGL